MTGIRPAGPKATTDRVCLVLLALVALGTGGWAYLAPARWYGSFPGFGLSWLPPLGPYNEHLAKDTGAMFLALGALAVLALLRGGVLPRVAGAAWLVFNVLHGGYHLTMLHVYGPLDQVLNVVALGLLAAASVVLVVPGRSGGDQPPRPEPNGEAGMSDETTTIVQLLLRERQGRDREWWPQMAAAFWPDSQVNLTWYTGDGPGFVAGSEEMSGRGDRSVHRLAPPVVHLAGARAWAEVSAAIEVRTTVDEVPVDLTSYARLGYRVERRDGEWRIFSLDAIYERDTVAPVLPGSVPSIPAEELAAFRPTYALLAWHLDRRGYRIGTGLLGDDRPAERDAYYDQVFNWLHA
ncbi:nuclear transport factor 2 family protein [Saccharopolyspora sp. 7B]|uniref:nuclear transport factor 2 family protein n=1 Tax=Saccharopolyspora sp. 7B TaxID=2877240 RepID=UPI001CD6455A|nr:nuclear transport factor 2 family protein [Saccharopolyspora sp. 7B]MCA1280853.1 nuclear transport factor 2 family protein [Saccharopolyspora sp. 7B]